MLRITRLEIADEGHVIKLEGKLLSPWVGEVLLACAESAEVDKQPRLDLSAVSYADSAGIALLRILVDRKVPIVAGSGYVGELLRGITP